MLGKILPRGKVLVVDDEEIMRKSLLGWLQEDGLEVVAAENAIEGLHYIVKEPFNVMLVDLKMPDMDGLQFLEKAKHIQPQTPVLIMTAYASVATATQAIKEGAYDYVTKPFNPEEISMSIQKILQNQRMLKENIQLRLHLKNQYDHHYVITNNEKMRKILDLIPAIADSSSVIVIQGEKGTGKPILPMAAPLRAAKLNGSMEGLFSWMS
jgi:two-component system response regulator AtoC